MVNAGRKDLGIVSEVLRLGLKLGAATAFDFLLTVHQIGEKKPPTFSRTAARVPRHKLAVTSWRAQPQIASSALKSGL